MIQADALKLLQDTAQQAVAAKIVPVPGDGRQAFVSLAGALEVVPVPPACRAHQVFSLADLVDFTKSIPTKEGSPPPTPVIFHGPKAVTLLIDTHDRRDVVIFPLTFSRPFMRLQALDQQPVAFDQRAFCRLLQFELAVSKSIVAPFRNLDWQTQVAVRGETAPGKDRLGREVLSQVKGTSDLPDEIVVATPVYVQQGERELVAVRCAVELDAGTQRLALVPFPNEIETQIDAAQARIHERLTESLETVPVFYGEP